MLTRITRIILVLGRSALSVPDTRFSRVSSSSLMDMTSFILGKTGRFCHTTPLLCFLHWIPVAACFRFKTLMLAHKAKNGPAPPYLKVIIPTPLDWSHHLLQYKDLKWVLTINSPI
ncbi:hypothetical protein Q7C36_019057 [Tachysurus vachellii]|uniref:Uncharacterized protein n=1 Tax=Tachysurus vachellii TaxID=175792 RepID=A0AA88LVU8_TACVA|nr:hypothetical protein Q7C36_019057 [Tachysurus vachellii]